MVFTKVNIKRREFIWSSNLNRQRRNKLREQIFQINEKELIKSCRDRRMEGKRRRARGRGEEIDAREGEWWIWEGEGKMKQKGKGNERKNDWSGCER